MIELDTTSAQSLRMTARRIAEQALSRGWKVQAYHLESAHLRLQRPDGTQLEIYSSLPPTTSYVAAHRADDKYATHILLDEHALPVPRTVYAETTLAAEQAAASLLADGLKVVVKPYDAAHGHGVTVNIQNTSQAREAITYAQQVGTGLIIQEYIEQPIDIRALCVNFVFQAALIRIPARVRGNGTDTVVQLIERENQSEKRSTGYRTQLNKIDIALVERYLGESTNHVVPADEWFQVLGTANVGTGGETQDVSDDVPAWFKQMAESAARASDLPICGVDFLLRAQPTAQATVDELQPVIIEVNKCPSLHIHELPVIGKSRPVVAAFLDYLASL